MSPLKRLIPWFLTLSLCLASSACQSAGSQEAGQLIFPRQGTFSEQVELVGEIEAIKQLYLAPTFSAKLEMLAEDGASVKVGERIARLETNTIEEELEEKKLELETARNGLVEHDRTVAGEKVRLDAEIQRAQALLDEKSLALKQLEAGTRPEELEKTSLQLELAGKALDLSRSNLGLKEKLAQKGMSTQLEVLQSRLDLSQKERDFKVAEATHQQARIGATPLARELARKEVEIARQALTWSRQVRELTLKKSGLERQRKQTRIDSEAAGVKERESRLQQADIKAPMAGTVVISKIWTGEGLKRVSIGDDVYEGNAFVSVADLSLVKIRTEVDETLIRELKPGMRCSIEMPSLKGRIFSGEITRIGVLAHTRTGRLNTQGLSKVFDLEILPEKLADIVFQPGTSVDITLPFKQRKDVILLPREAIHREGSRHFVYLADGSERDVKLGDANAKDVVIAAGLSLSEQVRLPALATDAEAETELETETENGSESESGTESGTETEAEPTEAVNEKEPDKSETQPTPAASAAQAQP